MAVPVISFDKLKVSPRRKENYVDNALFYKELKKYRTVCLRAKELDHAKPRMSEYLGDCFLRIASRISTKPNFKNYTFRDDMISDGIENCLVYVHNFNPDKSTNPFGYFTTVIHYAFIRRIQREKKHTYIKYKLMEKAIIDGDTAVDAGTNMAPDATLLNFENVQEFITRFDDYSKSRRARRRVGRGTKGRRTKP
jgi:DNA-directed RNA polymerase specialized sigma24 family protein